MQEKCIEALLEGKQIPRALELYSLRPSNTNPFDIHSSII